MKSYRMTYNSGVAQGLPEPTTDEVKTKNKNSIKSRLKARRGSMEAEKVLAGITVVREDANGIMQIVGPEAKIDTVRKFLREHKFGDVVESLITPKSSHLL